MLNLDPTSTIVFVDMSYYIFCKYYATFNWYKLSRHTQPDVSSLTNDEVFLRRYDKSFDEGILKIKRIYRCDWKNIVLVKDCIRDNVWRNAFYEDYKRSRDLRLHTFNGDIFRHVYNDLLPSLIAKYSIQMIEYEVAEADDIIAILKNKLRVLYPLCRIIIITNDNDYLQLVDTHTTLYNLRNEDISQRLNGKTPEIFLKIKILMGDKSDCIPSVFPKCGEKKALQYVYNEQALWSKLNSNPRYKAAYELNTLLIDMKKIPNDIEESVLSRVAFK
jgi:5'-3' exonuclease